MSEIGERDRVDVIITNPPFGGEEEKGVLDNFPVDRQTSETALLFLQLIMRKLKRRASDPSRPSRAAVIVPNGTLFAGGIAAKIRQDLVEQFNLHTVVRLPPSVFAPYAPIPTNILFFDTSRPTETVWFYQQPQPAGRQRYTKTRPITLEELQPCAEWWRNRGSSDRAWEVSAEDLRADGWNLDRTARKPPQAKRARPHRTRCA